MQRKVYQHRFFDKIREDFEKGTTFFYLYGNPLFDDFFENKTLLTANAIDTLAFNLFVQLGIKKIFLVEKGSGVSEFVINTNNNSIKWEKLSNEKLFRYAGRKDRSKSPTDSIREKNDLPSNESTRIDSDLGLLNSFRRLTEICQHTEEQIAIIINSFEWIADLFEGINPNLNILSEIDRWKNISDKKPLVFLLLKKIDVLKNFYNFNEKDNGVIYVSKPTVWEIVQLYRRFSKGILQDKTLEKIAMLLRNSNYSFYNIIHFYKKIIQNIGDVFSEDKFYERVKQELKLLDEDVSWDDIHIEESIKEKIITKFNNFLNSRDNIKKGVKGLLLSGLPGTGKTMIAKALANMGGFYFINVKLADLKGEYLGHSSKNIQGLFEKARANAPSLIFIDEVDAFFPIRARASDTYTQEMTNQFLAEIDGIDTGKQDVFILAATNRDDIMDPAVKSRLETIYVELPSDSLRLKILQNFLPDFQDVELCKKFIIFSHGFSGRDIKNISEDIRVFKEKYGNYNEALNEAVLKQRRNIIKNFPSSLKMILSTDKIDYLNNFIFFKKVRNYIFRVIQNAINKDVFSNFGLKPLSGILIYGPKGNCKSLLAKSVAKELNLDILVLDCAVLLKELINNYILGDIFEQVYKVSSLHKIMFLIKDIDLLFNNNGYLEYLNPYFLKNNLLKIKEHKNIVLVATSDEEPDILGQIVPIFTQTIPIYIKNIDHSEIVEIFNRLLNDGKFKTDEKLIFEQIEFYKNNIVGNDGLFKVLDILNICERAKYNAVFRLKYDKANQVDKLEITEIDFV